ncbi:MAG: glycine--tRNA ligase [archaeon]
MKEKTTKSYEKVIDLALRRNIFFPTAEIYGEAFSGFYDYGATGEAIKRKIVNKWRKELVQKEGFAEIDGCIILPEKVFVASGHLANFNDPLTQCNKCHSLHRADTLLEDHVNVNFPESMPSNKFDEMIEEHKINCPKCSGELGKVKKFNMMMSLQIGATGKQKAFLRPETCQNIFLNFDRIYKTMRQTLPLGISQVGRSFRNEIAPRQTILRVREINQMETEIFFNPKKINEVERFSEIENVKMNLLTLNSKEKEFTAKELIEKKATSGKLIAYYLARIQQLYDSYGIPREKTRFRELGEEEKAFYAMEAFDFEVQTSLGWIELIACNYRSDYDLKGHAKESRKDLSVKEDGDKFLPNVFEISIGVDRTLYVLIELALREEEKKGERRLYLDLAPSVAPFIAGVFPLVNKDGLNEKARELFAELQSNKLDVFFDEKASIGRRYARIDEVGVPFGITVDYDSMKDDTVTLRERNSTEQKRVAIKELPELLWELETGKKAFKEV